MDLLITVIGNAVVDPIFRGALLKDPAKAIEVWGLRLTKGESAMLQTMCHDESRDELAREMKALEDTLYSKIELPKLVPPEGDSGICHIKKCMCSIELPRDWRTRMAA